METDHARRVAGRRVVCGDVARQRRLFRWVAKAAATRRGSAGVLVIARRVAEGDHAVDDIIW